jgi:hypothetical protein
VRADHDQGRTLNAGADTILYTSRNLLFDNSTDCDPLLESIYVYSQDGLHAEIISRRSLTEQSITNTRRYQVVIICMQSTQPFVNAGWRGPGHLVDSFV